MASIENVTAAQLRILNIKGMDLRNICRKISIKESICTSYLSGEVVLLDHNQWVNNLAIIGLDPVQISFDMAQDEVSGGGISGYDVQMFVLSIQAEVSPTHLRSIIYTISAVTSEYFTDRGNVISESTTPGMTGVQLSQKIWGESGFQTSLVPPVQDSPLQDPGSNQPFHIDMAHPFTAIAQIRDAMNFPQYPTGNCLLYRDKIVENLVPLQYLFDTMGSQYVFTQTSTSGVNVDDSFKHGDDKIIDAKQQTRGSGTTGMGGAQDVAATSMQAQKKYDSIEGKLVNNNPFGKAVAAVGGGLASMIQGAGFSGGGHGGSVNMMIMNKDNRTQATDWTAKVPQERSFAALVKAGPQYNIRVPLSSGLQCTVGKGATFNLLPEGGEQYQPGSTANPLTAGQMLITDLIHDVYWDLKVVRGTTTFQTMKGLLA